jgi:hypothetical protein
MENNGLRLRRARQSSDDLRAQAVVEGRRDVTTFGYDALEQYFL